MNNEDLKKIEEITERAVKRALDRLKQIDCNNHPAMKSLEKNFETLDRKR